VDELEVNTSVSLTHVDVHVTVLREITKFCSRSDLCSVAVNNEWRKANPECYNPEVREGLRLKATATSQLFSLQLH